MFHMEIFVFSEDYIYDFHFVQNAYHSKLFYNVLNKNGLNHMSHCVHYHNFHRYIFLDSFYSSFI